MDKRMKAEKTVFESEFGEAARRTPTKDLDFYLKACEKIRGAMTGVKALKESGKSTAMADIYESRVRGSLQFISLKKLSRLAHLRSHSAREGTDKERALVDTYNLRLHNVHYEVSHLRREVAQCLQFKSKDEGLDLEPADAANPAPEDSDQVDRHNRHKTLLLWELEQRKSLCAQVDQSVMDLKSRSVDINHQKQALSKMKPLLTEVLKSTAPVQTMFGSALPSQTVDSRTLRLLPTPLYLLHSHVNAIRQVYGDKDGLEVSVEGDVDMAQSLIDDPPAEDEEDSESEAEEESEERSKDRKRTKAATRDKHVALRLHPLKVQLSMTCPGSLTLTMTFSYLFVLKMVTVKASLQGSSNSESQGAQTSEVLTGDMLLDCLYPGDDGCSSLSLVTQQELVKRRLDPSFPYSDSLGRPFSWAQRLCGLGQEAVFTETDSGGPLGEARRVLHKIKKRAATRIALRTLLRDLEKGLVEPTLSNGQPMPDLRHPISSLQSWATITYDDFVQSPVCQTDHSAQGAVNKKDLFFKGVIKHPKSGMTLDVYAALSPSYPKTAPLFFLAVHWQGNTRTRHTDLDLKAMEAEVNILFSSELAVSAGHFLLGVQVHQVLTFLDVYAEVKSSSSGSASGLLPRVTRGPSRAMPLKFSVDTQCFTHR